MSERTVTIGINIAGGNAAQSMLADILKQRDALLSKQRIKLDIDSSGLQQAQRAAAQARQASNNAVRDMALLGGAITSKAVAPTAQYTAGLAAALAITQKLGPALVSSLQRANTEFQRQRTLAQFWGTSGYMNAGVERFKNNLGAFLSTSGAGFSKWLQNTSTGLAAYRTGLVASSVALVGLGAAAAMSSKSSLNYINSMLNTGLMTRKHGTGERLAGAEAWVEEAQAAPWSAGRSSRMGIYESILSRNPYLEQPKATKATEDIEAYFFAHQELMKKKGIDSAEAMASIVSSQDMGGMGQVFDDIFGLGFSIRTPQGRFNEIGGKVAGMDMGQVVAERPEQAMALKLGKATQGLGDVMIGPLNSVLSTILSVAEAASKIPGLPQIAGWAIVLTGAAAAGLTVLSMLAGLAPVLGTAVALISKAGLAAKGFAVAQWALNIALSANPIGLAVVGIAALVAGLYVLEKKYGVLTKLWGALKGGLGSIGDAFREGGGMGVLKLAVGAIMANHPMMKLIVFVVDFLKKIWVNSEMLNKIMAGAITIWQQIGQFFSWIGDLINSVLDVLTGLKERIESFLGGEGEKKSLAPAEEQSMIDWAKGLKDNGHKIFDMGDEAMKAALKEAQTGVAQEHPNMANPYAYTELVDTFRNKLRNPSYGNEAVALGAAPGNPFYNPAMTNAIEGPGGIEIRTKPADEIRGSQDVEGGLQALGRWGWDKLFGPSMASGGSIISSGMLTAHGGEEIAPARAVVGGKTTLERMTEAVGGQGSGQINVSPHTEIHVHVDKVSSDVDMEKAIARASEQADRIMLFRLDEVLQAKSRRGIGYYRG